MKLPELYFIFLAFSLIYIGLSWLASGGTTWWIIDIINGYNVFYGDDAYRFFLAKSAWIDSSIFTYNFVLPVSHLLEGVLVTLAGGELFLSRAIHGVLASISLCLIWDAGRRIGINRYVMLVAVCIAGLIPRFSFTMLSFYGEFWLCILLSVCVWLFAYRRYSGAALMAGLLPLVRPEGIYFLIVLWLFFAYHRHWVAAMIAPVFGLAYALYLYIALPELSDYWHWRSELTTILSKIPFNTSRWEILHLLSGWLVLVMVLAPLNKCLRAIWPFLAAAGFWVILLQSLVLLDLAKFEERYLCLVFPLLPFLWGGSADWLISRFQSSGGRGLAGASISVLAFLAILGGFRQLTSVELNVRERGGFKVASEILSGDLDKVFIHHDHNALASRLLIVDKIEKLVNADRGIDRVIVGDPFVFYRLDPKLLPESVVVGFPATSNMIFQLLMGGQIFVQHSRGNKYSYLVFGEPDYRESERRALYIDQMPINGYPYMMRFPGLLYEMYLFSYLASDVPGKDMETVQPLTRMQIQDAWNSWLEVSDRDKEIKRD